MGFKLNFETTNSDVSLCLKGKSVEDSPETLVASTSDLDACLSRLVSKVLSLKNRPAEISLEAMKKQVEEAQVSMTHCGDIKVIYDRVY